MSDMGMFRHLSVRISSVTFQLLGLLKMKSVRMFRGGTLLRILFFSLFILPCAVTAQSPPATDAPGRPAILGSLEKGTYLNHVIGLRSVRTVFYHGEAKNYRATRHCFRECAERRRGGGRRVMERSRKSHVHQNSPAGLPCRRVRS